jgi:hypothetical protein
MAVNYSQLVNKNGTIYNTATGQGYPTPDALAKDLGISASSIQWGQITSNPNYTPQTAGSTSSGVYTGKDSSGGSFTMPSTSTPTQTTQTQQTQTSSGGYMDRIGTRPSPSNPKVIEYYDKQTGQGFSSPQALADFVNKNFPGVNATSTNVFSLIGGQYNAPPPGIDPSLWQQVDPATQGFLGNVSQLLQGQFNQGMANVSINADLLNKALIAAQNDPDLLAKYGDASKMALSDLQNNLGYINAEFGQNMALMSKEQEQARKSLTESEAAAGRAQSGFRQQAQDLLKQQQGAVIASSKRTLEQQVRQLGSQYESQFGTQALSNAGQIGAGGINYQPYGGITGSVPLQKKGDIQTKQQQIFNAEVSPLQ